MSMKRLWGSSWTGPVLIAALYALAAAVSLAVTRSTDGIATMWPSSGILLAGLTILPLAATPRVLATTALASIGANLLAGTSPSASLIFTLANVVEGGLAVTLVRRWCPQRVSFISPRDVRGFCAAVTVASLASTAIAMLADPGNLLMALSWFTTVMLGMLIVAPLLLILAALIDPSSDEQPPEGWRHEAGAMLALVASVTVIAFAQSTYPLTFAPLIALLVMSYRLGPVGAAAGVLTIAVLTSAITSCGFGRLAALPPREAAFVLQLYYVALFATALPLAALLTARRRLTARLAESERRFRLLADSSNDMIVLLSVEGRVLYTSPAAERLLGYAPAALVGQPLIDFLHPDDRAAAVRAAERVLAGEQEVIVFRHRRRDGGHVWMEAVSRPVQTPDGPGVVASIRDVSKRRTAELAAAEAQRRMQDANRMLMMAERAAGVGHWRIDFTGDSLFWSPEVFRIHGLDDFTPPPLAAALDFYHAADRARVTELVERSLATARGFEFAARIVRVDGEVRHVVSRGQPEIGYDGEPVGLFGTVQDVTRQVMVERELESARQVAEAAAARAMHMADTDALTGAASRRKALKALDDMIAHARAGGQPLALAIFDIDHFKRVNDRHGHQAGDAVLVRIARTAREAVRPTDLVGRLGGEEFIVLLPGANAAQAMLVAEQLRAAIAEPPASADEGPVVTTSIGIATMTAAGDAAMLLAEADAALYRAKAAGRNAIRLAA